MLTQYAIPSTLAHRRGRPRGFALAAEPLRLAAGRSVPGPTNVSRLKSSPWVRVTALIAAALTTYVLVASIAWLGLPPADTAPRLAQAAGLVLPR